VVHVAGAVVRPGIVHLRAGARVVDAIEAAGGARPDADLDALNLAAKVADGQRIGVGLPGQPGAAVPGGSASGGGVADGSASAGPLNLNTATQSEVESLPGIGPVLGAAILRERDQRGGFRSVDELRSVRGIGEKRFDDLRDLVTV
jgi:competence protein ComEA